MSYNWAGQRYVEFHSIALEMPMRPANLVDTPARLLLEADRTKAEADMYRQALGARTNGKSDAEVIKMMKAEQAAAIKQYGQPTQPIGKNQGRTMSEEQAIQMMRKASGNKSLTGEDMANMSDAEIEAMARKAAKRQ